MTFTYCIQKIDFFIDQVEEKGAIDLDGAMEAFQNFPFAEQLKEAEGREMTSCSPAIIFQSNNEKILKIWVKDDRGFFLHYNNKKQGCNYFISNDIDKNPEGLSVEEFIEQFFKGTIENSLELDEELKTDPNELELDTINTNFIFSFKKTNKIKYYLWTIPFLILEVYILRMDLKKDSSDWSVLIIGSLFWLPSTIVHISYWFKNHNAIVTIDTKAKTIEYEKKGKKIKFNRAEIFNCEVNVSRSGHAPWNAYKYLFIILHDGSQIVITNFITDPENIINLLKLNFKTEERTVPFLPISFL